MNGALVDAHGRAVRDLRVSVTDRCNLRCRYCMPAEGLPWTASEHLLSFDETARLVSLFVSLGVRSVRLTGGEPLVRRELHLLVERLAALDALDEIALTTNGVLLAQSIDALAAAGLTRVNVSLDTLDAERFTQITRRDDVGRVLEGLRAVERHARLAPIKVNVVAIRGFTEDEILAFAELARSRPYIVRFLEFMPLAADDAWESDKLLTGAEVRAVIEAEHELVELTAASSSTARRFGFADGPGEIGFVSPVSEPFCADCDRVRLTADGHLRSCLFSFAETDLRGPLRAGATNGELEDLIRDAVWRKPAGHTIGRDDFRQPVRSMSQIGG